MKNEGGGTGRSTREHVFQIHIGQRQRKSSIPPLPETKKRGGGSERSERAEKDEPAKNSIGKSA